MTEVMDSGMERHKTPHKLTVYSGIKYDPGEKMDKNKIVHHPSYLSTSLDKFTAKGFSNCTTNKHVLKIHVPKGHPGAYVDHFSENPGEKEFILPRNTKLKYRGTQVIGDRKGKILEHTMEIVK
jgi:hypothetical protein